MIACLALVVLGGVSAAAPSPVPDCTGPSRWPATMALVQLKNAGITSPEKIVPERTTVVRLATEALGNGLYRQVHLVTFVERSGKAIQVITVSDASFEECSMSEVRVFVISRQLGN
jgi:hypothetical protein